MDKSTVVFALVVTMLLALHACSQKNYSYSIAALSYQAVNVTPTSAGVRFEVAAGEETYYLDLEKYGRTHLVTVSSPDGKMGLWSAFDDDNGPRSRNLFAVYPDSGIVDVALDLASREVVEALTAANAEATEPYISPILLRSLPGRQSTGEMMAILGDGKMSYLALDNGSTRPGGGGSCLDTVTNNCNDKLKEFRDCKLQGGVCDEERQEAELACEHDVHPQQGNFTQVQ